VGTHTIFVGEVVNADVVDEHKACMTYDYYHQIKGGKTPKAAATYVDEKKIEEKPKEAVNKMAKYKCTVCGYIYDPEKGDPDGGINRVQPLKISPMTGYVLSVEPPRTNSRRRTNKKATGSIIEQPSI
jgi:hypothetical protein